MMHLTSVLLPAPFSPSSACKVPGRTFSSTLSSARKSPKRIVIEMASMPNAPAGGGGSPMITRAPILKFAMCRGWALDRTDQVGGSRHCAEHAALHLDHLDGVVVVVLVGRAAAIFHQHAFEAAIVGFAHGGVNADIGGEAGEHDILDAAHAQQQFEVGGAERSLAGLVDDGFAGARIEIRNDVPARLAAHENATARAGIADAGAAQARAPALVGRQIGKVGTMSFAGVDDVIA